MNHSTLRLFHSDSEFLMNFEPFTDFTSRLHSIGSPSLHSGFLILLFLTSFTLDQETSELSSRADVTPDGYHETERKNTVFPTGCKISPGTKTEIAAVGSRDPWICPPTPGN